MKSVLTLQYWQGMSGGRRIVDSSDEDDDDDADWLRPSVRKAAQGGDAGSDDDDFAVCIVACLRSWLTIRVSSRVQAACSTLTTLTT